MNLGLTTQQERVWRFIKNSEISPSYKEIADALDMKVNAVTSVVEALRHRGYVTGARGKQRALVAIDPTILSRIPTKLLLAEIERRAA